MRDAIEEPVQLAIFAKAPVAGYAKSRLVPALGARGAADLQAFLVRRTMETALKSSERPVTLWCAPDADHGFFRRLHSVYCIETFGQIDGDLGARMHDAFVRLTHRGPVLLIGTDCPVMSATHLDRCASALRRGADAVFTPAEDGGYVLVGLRRPQPRLFEDITFGTDTVMSRTRERLRELNLAAVETEPLWDIDTAEDYERARSAGLVPSPLDPTTSGRLTMLPKSTPSSPGDANNAAGLLVLRFFLGIFLLQWSVEKLILPSSAIRISQSFYNVALPQVMPYVLGTAELALSIALLLGMYRTVSYGLALAIHTVTVIVSWRQLLDPFGMAKIGNHLWIATWPTLGGFVALFLMRNSDLYTFDGWRERARLTS